MRNRSIFLIIPKKELPLITSLGIQYRLLHSAAKLIIIDLPMPEHISTVNMHLARNSRVECICGKAITNSHIRYLNSIKLDAIFLLFYARTMWETFPLIICVPH